MSVRVNAPAKINLTLKVGRPRTDGMHPLQSVVAFAPGGEWIEAAPASRLSLTILGPFAEDLPADDGNLVLRAAKALARSAGIDKPGAALTLYKDYPLASGIGGGSSDAAATLKALNALWRLGMSEPELAEIAKPLGADAPVCVRARAAFMTGLGEAVAPMTLPPLHAVLINPRTPMPTPAVYRRFDAMGLGADIVEEAAPVWPDLASVVEGARARGNDLAAPALQLAPVLGEISAWLSAEPRVLYANMSGSGASMFALAPDQVQACALAAAYAKAFPGHWVRTAVLG